MPGALDPVRPHLIQGAQGELACRVDSRSNQALYCSAKGICPGPAQLKACKCWQPLAIGDRHKVEFAFGRGLQADCDCIGGSGSLRRFNDCPVGWLSGLHGLRVGYSSTCIPNKSFRHVWMKYHRVSWHLCIASCCAFKRNETRLKSSRYSRTMDPLIDPGRQIQVE